MRDIPRKEIGVDAKSGKLAKQREERKTRFVS